MRLNQRIILALLSGTAASLIAGLAFSFSQRSFPIVAVLLAVALVLLLFYVLVLLHDFRLLRSMGIVRWERTMNSGTTAQDCVVMSQIHMRFLGIGASKWLANKHALRQMLQRHAGNGGCADFLLLDPNSVHCRRFEGIKNQPEGSLAKRIKENAAVLLSFRSEHLPVSVRFYNEMPRFRIAVVDNKQMIIGLYSFVSESGDNTPQLVLENTSKTWSYYTAFNAYFQEIWEEAAPAGEIRVFQARQLSE